jgi:hypothetical protein
MKKLFFSVSDNLLKVHSDASYLCFLQDQAGKKDFIIIDIPHYKRV